MVPPPTTLCAVRRLVPAWPTTSWQPTTSSTRRQVLLTPWAFLCFIYLFNFIWRTGTQTGALEHTDWHTLRMQQNNASRKMHPTRSQQHIGREHNL